MELKNLEFNITWCENNIRWLCGDPPSEERERKITFNATEVERLELKCREISAKTNVAGLE